MMKIFVTGIGTDVGKTVIAAIIVEALKADYWKPVQAGDLEFSDSHVIQELISNSDTQLFENSYALKTAMSPHAAAEIDGINIELDQIHAPKTENHLVIEGAGGLLVPLNDSETILDLIEEDYKIIVVSKHYLGSINHTLLTVENLIHNGFKIAGIIFNGREHKSTEEIIAKITEVPILGRIDDEKSINKKVIKKYANSFKSVLEKLV